MELKENTLDSDKIYVSLAIKRSRPEGEALKNAFPYNEEKCACETTIKEFRDFIEETGFDVQHFNIADENGNFYYDNFAVIYDADGDENMDKVDEFFESKKLNENYDDYDAAVYHAKAVVNSMSKTYDKDTIKMAFETALNESKSDLVSEFFESKNRLDEATAQKLIEKCYRKEHYTPKDCAMDILGVRDFVKDCANKGHEALLTVNCSDDSAYHTTFDSLEKWDDFQKAKNEHAAVTEVWAYEVDKYGAEGEDFKPIWSPIDESTKTENKSQKLDETLIAGPNGLQYASESKEAKHAIVDEFLKKLSIGK